MTDYRDRTPSTVSADASLAGDLDSFYALFEASNNTVNRTVAVLLTVLLHESMMQPASSGPLLSLCPRPLQHA